MAPIDTGARSAKAILAAAKEAQFHAGYLARYMSQAFDGALTDLEANSHASLSAILGELTTIVEVAGASVSAAKRAKKGAK